MPQYSSCKGPEQELETAPPAAECSLTLPCLDTALPCFVPDRALELHLLLDFEVNRFFSLKQYGNGSSCEYRTQEAIRLDSAHANRMVPFDLLSRIRENRQVLP